MSRFTLHGTLFLLLAFLWLPAIGGAASDLEQGIAEFKAENYEEASVSFAKAYSANPRDAKAAAYLGLAYKEMQDHSLAVRYLREAYALSPTDGEIGSALAEAYFTDGKYDESLQTLDSLPLPQRTSGAADFLRGLAYMKKKQPTPAIAAFTKARNDPSLRQQADYQIAAAYVEARDYAKAQSMFQSIIQTSPTSNWAAFSREYLDAINRVPSRFRLMLGAGIQYDSNVLGVPRDQQLVDIDRKSDFRRTYAVHAEYALVQGPGFGLNVGYNFDMAQYFKKDYDKRTPGQTLFSQDTVSNTLWVTPSYTTNDYSLSLLLSFNTLEVDYTHYADTYIISPALMLPIATDHFGQISLKYARYEQPTTWSIKKFGAAPADEENRSGNSFSVAFDHFYQFAKGQGLIDTRFELESNNAKGKNWEYGAAKFSVGVVYPLIDNTLKAGLYSQIVFQNFTNINSFYDVKRRDTIITIQPSLTYTIFKPLDLVASFAYINDHSNIPIYKTDRSIVALGLEYRF